LANVRAIDHARMLPSTLQAVNRLTNLRHSNKIDRLMEAFQTLGKSLR
jgi:hypothetical protein